MSQTEIDTLYRTYGFIIYGRCIRILGDREDARDAMQVVFMKLLQAYATIRDKEKVVPWIFRAAQNHCFNILRDRRKFAGDVDVETTPCSDTSSERLIHRDLIERICGFYRKDVVDAVHLTYVEELDQKEIGTITGQSPATIRRNLARFKAALPGILKRLGIHEM